VREEQVGEVFVLSFESSFPHETEEVEELHHKVQDALSRGHARFVVNLQGVESLKAPALGVLKSAAEKCHDRGGHLVVCCAGRKILDVLWMTKLDTLFRSCDSEEDALAYIAKQGRP
jgi:anti-anti-sigma factor